MREYPGWRTRARGSGGYDPGRPTHVMIHHTASGSSWDGQRDADYCAVGAPVAPISNLYLDRRGTVWVLAAGATNTNGTGSDWWGGGVPTDDMNRHAIGIEAGNTGVGEPWPDVQQDAYVRLCRVLCAAYGITYNRVRAHHEWRRSNIDPAGPSRWATGGNRWDMESFRATVAAVAPPQPPPEVDIVTDEDMDRIAWKVWSIVLNGQSTGNHLQRAAATYTPAETAPGRTVNFKVPVPIPGGGSTQQDLWSVIVDGYERIKRIEGRLTALEQGGSS